MKALPFIALTLAAMPELALGRSDLTTLETARWLNRPYLKSGCAMAL